MKKKILVSILLILGVCAISLNSNAADVCGKVTHIVDNGKDQDLIAVINYHTKQSSLYSNTIYNSVNCLNYVKIFQVRDPDVVKSSSGFCMVLPASEIQSGLKCVKIVSCISAGRCKPIIFKLTWDKQLKRYTKASPSTVTMEF